MIRHVACASAVGAAVLAAPAPACAHPQWNVGIVTGVCGTGNRPDYWQDTCWWNGLRADVLFGRERNADFAVGPYVDAYSADLQDGRLGSGASLLLPVHPFVPFVLSAGAYARDSDQFGWEPGVGAWLFAGSRSYNFHSTYGIATGLMLGFQYGLGESHETAIVIGFQFDGQLTVLPFLLLYDWIRGRPDEEE